MNITLNRLNNYNYLEYPFYANRRISFIYPNTNNTYTELVSSGQFDLIKDKDLNLNIISYFSTIEENHINAETNIMNIFYPEIYPIYNKFSLELRYPLTLKPSASIYGLAFLEGGNAFNNFQEYNPFDIKRSAGVGLRIFMPAFGLLGIDFGYGFDADNLNPLGGANGWETHFIIGQQF